MQRVAHIVRQLADQLRKDAECESQAAASCRTINCLIVEDEESDAVLSLEAISSVGGVAATLARSGDEALRMLTEAEAGDRPKFEIVFVDLKLNGSEVQGKEVIEQIRRRFPQTHTVIISGYLGQNVLDALRGGYAGIIEKPLVRENLAEILDKHRLRRHED